MIDAEVIRFIRQEIDKQMNIVLSGVAGNSDGLTEDIQQLYPSMPTIPERPVMHPFGLMSAAPDGTISVTARQGSYAGNRMVIGHRDGEAPSVVEGETIVYDNFDNQMSFSEAGVAVTSFVSYSINNVGTMSIKSNEVELLSLLQKLLTTIINARTNTIFGPQPLIPDPLGIPEGETFLEIQEQLSIMQGGV